MYMLGMWKLFFYQYFVMPEKRKFNTHIKLSLQLYILWLFSLQTVFLFLSFQNSIYETMFSIPIQMFILQNIFYFSCLRFYSVYVHWIWEIFFNNGIIFQTVLALKLKVWFWKNRSELQDYWPSVHLWKQRLIKKSWHCGIETQTKICKEIIYISICWFDVFIFTSWGTVGPILLVLAAVLDFIKPIVIVTRCSYIWQYFQF